MNGEDTQRLWRAILEILEDAEKKCTNIILDAVRTKDQKGMELAGEVTIKLREIIENLQRPVPKRNEEALLAKVASSAKPKRRVRKGEYPKFHVENGYLVKVGWSKKAKEEYVHKLPRETYDALLEIISRRASESPEQFTAEEILQACEQLPESVPNYHVYLALGFLQDNGILKKHGRRGYTAQQEIKESGRAAFGKL